MKTTTAFINTVCKEYNAEQKKMLDMFWQYWKMNMRDILKERLLWKYIIDARPIRKYLHNLMTYKKRCDMNNEIFVIDANGVVAFLESIIKRW